MMYTIIAFTALFVSIYTAFRAIKGDHKLYWISAIGMYVFSFLAGFSIGQLTVGFSFVLLILAICYSLKWIKTKVHVGFFTGVGAVIGFLLVRYVDDGYLFFPLSFFV